MNTLVIVGAGGFGREVFNLVRDINLAAPTWDVLGFLDDRADSLVRRPVYGAVLGGVGDFAQCGDAYLVCAVGDPAAKSAIVRSLSQRGARWATLVHPSASVGIGCVLGPGCVVCHQSVVTVDAAIGGHVHVNCFSCVGHDAQIGDYGTLSPHAAICGGAVLEEGVFVGTHAVVTPNVRVGAWAKVGAGAVVLRDAPERTTVVGVPAKPSRPG